MRLGLVILADTASRIDTAHIEIAKERNAEATSVIDATRIAAPGLGVVHDDALAGKLRPPVRIHRSLRARLVDRQRLCGWLAIGSARRAEHHPFDVGRIHSFEQRQRSREIGAPVDERLFHAFANISQGGKVHDRIDPLKGSNERLGIAEVCANESEAGSAVEAEEVDGRLMPANEAINDGDLMSLVEEAKRSVRSDEAGTAGDEDMHDGHRLSDKRRSGSIDPPPRPMSCDLMAITAILIGTAATIRSIERQLAIMSQPPVLLGCVLHADDVPVPRVRGIPVLGTLTELESICQQVGPSLALVSLPSVMSELIDNLRMRLRRLGVVDRFIATLDDQLAGVGPRTERDIDLAALVGRPPRALDETSIARVIRGRTVVITGAGGSIGGELCRIAARYQPDRLVMVERSENALFEIDRQIARKFPQQRRHAALHDVVDATATKELFAATQPDIVFHAAAHKHVPMSEDHPGAAIDNNLFGTISTADAAVSAGAERFVMVSTDKAVNPTSVMGMTKRLAELYVQHVHRHGQSRRDRKTACSMVRFGNVLGSSGSVLDTWKRQIADGGPVTVTDPRMTRYFMTIPEAAALVIQAAALHDPSSADGEVFVLDMGEPFRVVDLAAGFIAAHGLVPRFPGQRNCESTVGAMSVVFSGVRPGEKLFEELALDRESIRPTRHPDIRIWGLPAPDPTAVMASINDLAVGRRPRDAAALTELIRRHVPELRTHRQEGVLARVA